VDQVGFGWFLLLLCFVLLSRYGR